MIIGTRQHKPPLSQLDQADDNIHEIKMGIPGVVLHCGYAVHTPKDIRYDSIIIIYYNEV